MSASRRRSSKENAAAAAAIFEDPEKAAEHDVTTGGKVEFSTVVEKTKSTEVLPDLPTRSRSKSRELSKKQGGGKKGLWGKPEDLIVIPKDGKHDPNFDSEEETEDVILVTSTDPNVVPPPSPTTRSLAKVALFDGNPRSFGLSPVPTYVKKQIEEIVSEYFTSGDVEEVRIRLSELSSGTEGEYNYELVKRAITMSMDKHEKEREAVSRLLSELYLNGLTPTELAQAFRRVLVSADDLALDIPTAVHMLSIFAARAIVDEILPPRFLEDPILATHSPDVVQEAVKKLSINHGTVRMEKGWGPGDGRPVEELKVAIDQLTKEYLLSGDLDEAARCVRELNVEHFHHEVVKRGIINSFEEGKEYCNAMGSLLAYLVSQEIVSPAQLRKGFDKVAISLPDLQLDIPAAGKLLAALVKRAQSDGILPSDYKHGITNTMTNQRSKAKQRQADIDPLPWYRNTFASEGVIIDEETGALSYVPKSSDNRDDGANSIATTDRPAYKSPVPRIHASAWTRRLEKLEPIANPNQRASQKATKLLGRMSWDPRVLENEECSKRTMPAIQSKEKLRSSLPNAKLAHDSVLEATLAKLRTNTAVQSILKQNESKYMEDVERSITFTPVAQARSSLLSKFSFHDTLSNLTDMDAIPNEDPPVQLQPQRQETVGRLAQASLTKDNQTKYFGEPAKQIFYSQFKQVASRQHLFRAKGKKNQIPDEQQSLDATPRTKLVVGSLSSHRPAIPLVIRKHTTSVFDFSYQSLGDGYIAQFAACLDTLPFVEEINVRDNRLSDEGLNALLVAIHKNLKLRKLDISENEIGSNAAVTMRMLIESKDCTIKHLVMEKSDIDDFECAAFMTAFEKNISVVELYMPRNRIGEAEQLNVVQPEITTGGEAIASMLYVNLNLLKLDISWNLLRLESGVTLAKSLEFNKKLLELHVAYNACGDVGAMMFGHALTLNNTLRTLDLSYNNVGCRGALVLASAASKNKCLRRLVLNGNNIGKEGGRALMFAMCSNQTDQGCDIEIAGCNLASTNNGKSGKDKIFDPTDPAGEYSLELTDPFDQMIANELLRLATYKKGCRFEKLKHHSRTERVKNKGTMIQLVHPNVSTVFNSPLDVFYAQSIAKQQKKKEFHVDAFGLLNAFRSLHMNPSLDIVEAVIEKMKAEWSNDMDAQDFSDQFFQALFALTDVNESGGIDAGELQGVMKKLGIEMSHQESMRIISQYDLDSSGTIEDFEFVEFMKAHVRYEAFGSKKSLAGLDPNRFALRDASTNQIWQIPLEGHLEISFVYEREAVADVHDAKNRISDAGIAQLIRNIHLQAKSSTEKLELLYFAISDSEILFSASQAYELLDQCGGLAKEVRVQAVTHALFQVITAKDAQRLVSTTLNLRERSKLKVDLGNAYVVIMGNPTAHFALDLSNRSDRWVAQKLVEIAQAEKKASIASCRGDTSQHMNWENFRNETLDGEKIVLTTSFFNSLPQSGRLDFDYVSTSRPPRGTKPLSNRRYEQLVRELAKDCFIIDLPDSSDQPDDPKSRARRRWKKLRDVVLQNQFMNLINYARNHIFRIKNCRDEVRLKLVQIETAVSDRYLTAQQASRIVMSMPQGFHGRVEAARVLFSRLIDVGNFCDILDLLDSEDQKELVHVLGWLNIFNPDKPDRFYELDLSVLEDYNMAKILIRLAVIEEGDNWLDGYTYSPSKTDPPYPNWILPVSWDADDKGNGEGPRRSGVLRLYFTSKLEDGCIPDWDARKEMKKRVLCGP